MIYLDHAATSPPRREALEAMWPYLTTHFGNASSTHELGRQARVGIDTARAAIADVLHCSPVEIVFTSGGTEADNLAVRGAALALPKKRQIVTTAIEHKALLETCVALKGFETIFAAVDSVGLVDVNALEELLTADVTLCSVMYANNEIGTVQPVFEIAELCRAKGVPFHTDAVQAAGLLPLDVGADLLSISAHKFGGPKGIGALYVRSGFFPEPLVHGGGQERGLRSGTENVAAIAGMGAALTLAESERNAFTIRAESMRERLMSELSQRVEGLSITGSREHRLANHVSFTIDHVFGESLLVELETEGIVCSSGSACSADSDDVSHVLTAIGVDEDLARTAVRLTLGPETSESEIEHVINAFPPAVARVRALV